MNVEILALPPIFVEEKYVGIIVADVKMIVNAAGLGPRPINETAQKFKKFCTFFWSGVQSSCEGATWFHIFFRVSFDHGGNVYAICFFRDVIIIGRSAWFSWSSAMRGKGGRS
jgi:hypothetical protein